MLNLDLVQTIAFAGAVLFAGTGLCRRIRPLSRLNIPAPVVGGLVVALAILIARLAGIEIFQFDTTLRDPLMIAFFTTLGFGASLSVLKTGGPQILFFLFLSTCVGLIQNVLGVAMALIFGLDPLFGVIAGSVTLTGGPATGLAFAPLFEEAGVQGAATIAVAAAMFGIISGGLIGGPIATFLIERSGIRKGLKKGNFVPLSKSQKIPDESVGSPGKKKDGEDGESHALLKNLVILLVVMWAGLWLSKGLTALGITLPAYIGAMFLAAVIRNVDDATHCIGLSHRTIGDLGHVSLSLFLALALMTLKLWELAGLVLPLIIILLIQVLLVILLSFWPLFKLLGKDYDAAVMVGGFCGFMLGTTANAMANMKALEEQYGQAPRAFLVVPIVAAFFIDFTNAFLITVFLNLFK